MTKRKYSNNLGMLDLFCNALLVFLILFLLSIPIQPNYESPIEQKAEFIIEIEWQPERNDDVDLWLKAPTGEVVYFSNRQDGVYHLDRDDLGRDNDTIVMPDGTKKVIEINREVLTLRGVVPGKYTTNVHLYRLRNYGSPNIEVKAKIYKLNPFKILTDRTIVLSKQGQERTIASFTVDIEGNVTQLDENETAFIYANRHQRPATTMEDY